MGSRMRAGILAALLVGVGLERAGAQTPAPGAVPAEPTLPAELRLERENLLLTARVNELETQIAALRAQVIGERIGKAAPGLIERLQAAAPGWDVNPQTLAMTPKTGAVAPPVASGAVAPRGTPAPEPRP